MTEKEHVRLTVAAESTRPKLERKAKADASERMGGKLEPLRTIHVEPKKTPTPKKTSGKLRKATGYKSMVKRAINENVNRKGTSLASIVNYIAANYDVKDNFRRYLKASLARQVESGLLVKKSPARYALTTKSKAKKATKKATKKAVKKDGEKKVRKTSTKTTSKSDKKKDTPKKLTKKVTKKTTAEKPKKVTVRKTGDTKTSRTKKVAEKALPKKLARGKAALASPRTAGAAETAGSASTDNSTLVWVWQYYDNGFFNYDPAGSDVVEGVYQEYLTSPFTCDVRAVKSGQWEYEIDFRVMTQRNIKHSAHTSRKIRRVQIPASEKNDTKKRYEGSPEDTN